MKKGIGLLLLLAVLLTGCQSQPHDATLPPQETTQATQPEDSGIYLPESSLEQQSHGVLRLYEPEHALLGLTFLESQLLAVYETEQGVTLSLYAGENLTKVSETTVDAAFRLDNAAVQVGNALSYYDEDNREVVLLGSDLLERERVLLPQDAVEEPAVASDFSAIYYSTGSQIRVMDIKSGTVRLLREMAGQQIHMQRLCFSNTVLMCQVTDADETYTAFLSAQTGQTLHTDDALVEFATNGNWYFAQRSSVTVIEQIFGTRELSARMLAPLAEDYVCLGVPQLRAALTVSDAKTGDQWLDLYQLETGYRSSSVRIPAGFTVASAVPDPTGQHVWLALKNEEGQTFLCCWKLTPSENTTDYTTPWYTRENPDTEALAECQEIADRLSKTYGVKVHILQKELVNHKNYAMIAAYQPKALKQGLADLEAILSRFPDGFFPGLAKVTGDGVLHINLVETIDQLGSRPDPAGLRYWVGGKEYISVSMCDQMEQGLYHELYHALDTFLLGNSGVLDTWNKLNPKDFTYDGSYDVYESRVESPLFSGKNRAFVDSYAMTYPTEDRARVFVTAIQTGNADCFTSPTMQAKLKLLCKAIRDAYGWKKDTRTFPWEQYLKK